MRRLQLEHELLMKANELIKKDMGIDQQVLTNREKTLLAMRASLSRQRMRLSEKVVQRLIGLPPRR